MTPRPPTLSDVLDARRSIKAHLRSTPLHRYPLLDRLVGAPTYVKHENHLPIGAFKIRGGINLISKLGRSERQTGVFAASTGNHGQSIAYAARRFGVPASDDELRTATLQMIELTRNLVEPAGAAPLAAAMALRERLAGKRVALVCSGGNISPGQLAELLTWGRERVHA